MISQLIALIALFAFIFVLPIVTNIYGWGLHPQNWWVIIFGFLGQIFILALADVVKKDVSK